jgi:hypothetical protein
MLLIGLIFIPLLLALGFGSKVSLLYSSLFGILIWVMGKGTLGAGKHPSSKELVTGV